MAKQVIEHPSGGPVPPDVDAAARTATHPAMALRAGHARLSGMIPSLIMTGGTETSRDVTAALYLRALAATGALSRHKFGQVRWAREEDLLDLTSDARAELADCPLLVLTDVGAVVREDSPEQAGLYPQLGRAPVAVGELLHARGERLPTVMTTLLPVGNPPVTDAGLDHGYRNYALHKALEERGRAGWAVPSPVTGFDPDARLTTPGTATLREHLGEASWWRLYLTALATAVDANALQQPSS